MKNGLFRILDANLNRSREGLRVCEEISRFILNSEPLSRELKRLRHGIADNIKGLPGGRSLLFYSRNTKEDVLRSSRLATEVKRSSAGDIFTANIQRVKESLRVLEEFAKLVDSRIALRFQRLRFRTYDVEKKAAKKIYPLRNSGCRGPKR